MADASEGNTGQLHWFGQLLLTRPWFALLFFVVSVVAIAAAIAWLVHRLSREPALEELSYNGATVKFFQRESAGGGVERYVFVVSPQGWVKSPVEVSKGDRLRILAGGSVTIDMFDIVRYSRIRNRIEKVISKKIKADWSHRSPEDFYDSPLVARDSKQIFKEEALPCQGMTDLSLTVEERLLPCRGWTGPSGYPGESAQAGYPDTAFVGRTGKKISPQNPFGALIGTFDSPADPSCSVYEIEKFEPRCIPTRQASTFLIGSEFPAHGGEFPVDQLSWKEGEQKNLWLIVNDVLDDGHKFPEKFYVDNLGSFYVEVEIKHAEPK
jgi:hypothetical protein